MNANPLLKKLTKLRNVIEDEQTDMNESITILEANVESLKKEYNNILTVYLQESKLLKSVMWKLYYADHNDTIILHETNYKIDIKAELKDLAQWQSTFDAYMINLWDTEEDDPLNIITLWIPSEDTEPPYIQIKNLNYLEPFLNKYELDVDLSELTRVIDVKSKEIESLNQIKQAVPN